MDVNTLQKTRSKPHCSHEMSSYQFQWKWINGNGFGSEALSAWTCIHFHGAAQCLLLVVVADTGGCTAPFHSAQLECSSSGSCISNSTSTCPYTASVNKCANTWERLKNIYIFVFESYGSGKNDLIHFSVQLVPATYTSETHHFPVSRLEVIVAGSTCPKPFLEESRGH